MQNQLKKFVRVFVVVVVVFSSIGITVNLVSALSGNYNYASSGGYYSDTGGWSTKSGEGYCGHMSASCSPTSMRYISSASTCAGTAYARWDNIDSAQYGVETVFIPRVKATETSAPYTIAYNGSTYSFRINQNAYYDVWVTPSTSRFYNIFQTYLTDGFYYTCGVVATVGADEIRILY